MRKTFTDLQTEAHDYTQTDSSDSSVNTFLKREVNDAYTFTLAELAEYVSQKVNTTTTVADQQYYDYPRDLKDIESVVLTQNSVDYDLDPINSQSKWNKLNTLDWTGVSIPVYFFPRRDDFGIWPIPQSGGDTLTLTYSYYGKEMTAEDYTTGTVSVTNDDATVTGSGTSFTSAMEGRWFKVDSDGDWYRVKSVASGTSLELDSVYNASTASGENYTIGESPEVPIEAHKLLSYKAAAEYFDSIRKNPQMAQYWRNKYYTGDGSNTNRQLGDEITGGLLGLKRRYAQRSNRVLIKRTRSEEHDLINDKLFGTTISK